MCCMPFLLFSSHVSVHAVRQIVEKILQNNTFLSHQAGVYYNTAMESPDPVVTSDEISIDETIVYAKNPAFKEALIRALHAAITTHGLMQLPIVKEHSKKFPARFAFASLFNLIILKISKEMFMYKK